ncbi:MAG: hypothetical protein HQL28_05080 [Candidatus Omnitrophica bacterium]|nr:hypothetical protein [Candidatus Omnitrophota bacterium]
MCDAGNAMFVYTWSDIEALYVWIDSGGALPDLGFVNPDLDTLPGKTAFLQKIKERGSSRDIKIIAVTQGAPEGTAKGLKEQGYSDYIPKLMLKKNFSDSIEMFLG